MKKLFLSVVIFLSSVLLLTGCATTPKVDKKAEAVKAAKATIDGLIKGNKTEYEAYYGTGTYETSVEKALKESSGLIGFGTEGITAENQKKFFELSQKVFAKIKTEYTEKSEVEVSVKITPLKMDQEIIGKWVMDKITSGLISKDAGTEKGIEYIMNAVINGEIVLPAGEVVEKTVTLKEVEGKFQVEGTSIGKIQKAMLENPTMTV